jgi:hypothetical protein
VSGSPGHRWLLLPVPELGLTQGGTCAQPRQRGGGQGRLNEVRPVAEVMASLVREADETLERMAGLR